MINIYCKSINFLQKFPSVTKNCSWNKWGVNSIFHRSQFDTDKVEIRYVLSYPFNDIVLGALSQKRTGELSGNLVAIVQDIIDFWIRIYLQFSISTLDTDECSQKRTQIVFNVDSRKK